MVRRTVAIVVMPAGAGTAVTMVKAKMRTEMEGRR